MDLWNDLGLVLMRFCRQTPGLDLTFTPDVCVALSVPWYPAPHAPVLEMESGAFSLSYSPSCLLKFETESKLSRLY